MGLIGGAVDVIKGGVDTVGKAVIDPISNTVLGTDDPYANSVDPVTDAASDAVSSTEEAVNDGAGDVVESASQTSDPAVDGAFSAVNAGVETVEGFFNAIGGGFDWLADGISLIPVIPNNVKEFFHFLIGGIGAFFHGIAGVFGVVSGFFEFVSSLSGLEGGAFLVGLFLMGISGYIIIQGLYSGEVLLVWQFARDTADALMGFWTGMGLVIWATAPLVGSIMLASSGFILLFFVIVSEERQLISFAIPVFAVGWLLLFAHFGFRFTGTVILTSTMFYAAWKGLNYLETDAAFELIDQPESG